MGSARPSYPLRCTIVNSINTHMYTCVYIYIYIYIYTYTFMCICIHTYNNHVVHVETILYMVCMHVCRYMCVYMCIYIYIHIYIHTHIVHVETILYYIMSLYDCMACDLIYANTYTLTAYIYIYIYTHTHTYIHVDRYTRQLIVYTMSYCIAPARPPCSRSPPRCHIRPCQPMLRNSSFPSEPVKTYRRGVEYGKFDSEGGRVWQV